MAIGKFASTEGTLPDATCLLCGVEIRITDKLGMPRSFPDHSTPDDEKHWKSLWKPSSDHFIVPSHEVENIYIDRFPLLWSSLFRAIIKDSDTRYHLTGISSTQGHQGPHYAVNDPSKARIAGRKKPKPKYPTDMFTQFYAADYKRKPSRLKEKTIGFVVHAYCWTMFDHIDGIEGINNINLAKLVRGCREFWRERPGRWGISTLIFGTLRPHIMPGIQQVMIRAKTENYQPSSSTSCSSFDILPYELRVLICDFTCPITDYTVSDIRNLRSLLSGFGWELPMGFWRVRLDEPFFFELKHYEKELSADSKTRIEFMRLVPMRNRKRLNYRGLVVCDQIPGIMRALGIAYKTRRLDYP